LIPPNLNTHQRIVLGLVGVAIFLIQIYKFDEYGLDGSGWVIAFFVAAILILPSLSLIKAKASKETVNQEKFKGFIEQSSRVQIAFKRIQSKSEELKDLIAKVADLPNLPTLAAINNSMVEEWGRNCFIYIAALSAVAEFKKSPDFIRNQQFVVYEAQVVRHALNSSKLSAIDEGFGEQHDDNRVKTFLLRDWNLAKSSMMRFLDNLALSKQHPEEPLLEFLFEKTGVPENMRKELEVPLREFTKNTLRDFAQQ